MKFDKWNRLSPVEEGRNTWKRFENPVYRRIFRLEIVVEIKREGFQGGKKRKENKHPSGRRKNPAPR